MSDERRPPDEGLDDADLLDPDDGELDGIGELPDPGVDELAELDEDDPELGEPELDEPELDGRAPWAE